jgi:NAD(P)-dependent dehydrogenase (short-subunit alcohol dehydrogenase family)
MTPKRVRTLVTGAASGIGLQVALKLAARNCHVIVADRNVAGGEATVTAIAQTGGSAEFRPLDLGSLAAIRTFSAEELSRGEPLDVMINNAGLLPPMARATTSDGFELAFGVAYLGHFALTALLLPALLRSLAPRVVSISSNSHPNGRIDFDNLQLQRGYQSSQAYMNSKLACLMFAFELQRRADQVGARLLSVAAHPGISRTPIANRWRTEGRRRLMDRFELFGYQALMQLVGQGAEDGARPLVHAALDPSTKPGGYYGPTGFMQARGHTGLVQPAWRALDTKAAQRLWECAEQLTNVRWQWRNKKIPAGEASASSESCST